MQIEIIRITKIGGPLTKHIGLAPDGSLKSDGSSCVMPRGMARRVQIPGVAHLARLIETLRSDQAIALGRLRPGLAGEVAVVTKRKLNGVDGAVIARSREFVAFASGSPGYVLLDFDSKAMPEDVRERVFRAGGFWDALVAVVPELAGVARLVRASTSAGLRRRDTGETVPGSDGVHVYVEVADVSDSSRFLKALHQRCWLEGLGWYMVGRGGQLLERSIIDRMVGDPERLCFEGAPVLDPRLEQDAEARRPHAIEGFALDTLAVCPPLTPTEETRLGTLRARARRNLADEAARAREKFIAEGAEEIVRRKGVSRNAAQATMRKWCEGVLLPDVVLPFDDPELEGKTVSDVLADPAAFEGEVLADPLEGIEYGRGKAIVMRRPDGTLWIHSFAHGLTVYEMRLDATAVRLAIEKADAGEAARVLIDLLMRAEVDLVEEEALIRLAGKRSGGGMRTVQRELKAAREAQAKAERAAARERRRALRDDQRPLMEAPDADAEYLPVMEALNGVLGASAEAMPPARNLEGCLARPRMMASHDCHAFATANEYEPGEDSEEAPPSWRIHALSIPETAELIERYVEFTRRDRTVHLEQSFVIHYRQRDDGALPVLAAVASLPFVSADGDLVHTEGLDRKRGIAFFVDQAILAKLPRREQCDRHAVAGAMRFLLDEWLVDVAADLSGKCTLIALALSFIERLILNERPAFWVVAGRRSAGKTTTLKMLFEVLTAQITIAMSWSPLQEERRKALHSYLIGGAAYILYDNIPRGSGISCPHIERALTSKYYEDRRLGASETVRTAATTLICFTGNNVGPKGDLASRSLTVRLEVNRADPENRRFKHPDPLGWTQAHRGEILRALYTVLLGNPALDLPRDAPMPTRFKLWQRVVGSAIEHAVKCVTWTDPDRGELPPFEQLESRVSFASMFLDQEDDEEDAATLGDFLVAAGEFAAQHGGKKSKSAAVFDHLTKFGGAPTAITMRAFLFPKDATDAAINAVAIGLRLKARVDQVVRCGECEIVLRSDKDPDDKKRRFWVETLNPKNRKI